jgi:hypothetical protein
VGFPLRRKHCAAADLIIAPAFCGLAAMAHEEVGLLLNPVRLAQGITRNGAGNARVGCVSSAKLPVQAVPPRPRP